MTNAVYNKHLNGYWLRSINPTCWIESGPDIRYIQELLGHKNNTTTEIYKHIARSKKLRSPLDSLRF